MKRQLLMMCTALTVIASGSALLARPVDAATMPRNCSISEIIDIIDYLCPNGGRASNVEQTPDGCSFDLSCNAT